MKNSWEIIKEAVASQSCPGTLGHNMAMQQCAALYVRLMHNLTDRDVATAAMNKDADVREGLLALRCVEALRKADVL